jgi:hypothetical protein
LRKQIEESAPDPLKTMLVEMVNLRCAAPRLLPDVLPEDGFKLFAALVPAARRGSIDSIRLGEKATSDLDVCPVPVIRPVCKIAFERARRKFGWPQEYSITVVGRNPSLGKRTVDDIDQAERHRNDSGGGVEPEEDAFTR